MSDPGRIDRFGFGGWHGSSLGSHLPLASDQPELQLGVAELAPGAGSQQSRQQRVGAEAPKGPEQDAQRQRRRLDRRLRGPDGHDFGVDTPGRSE